MEQVIHDLCLGTVLPDLQVECGVHIHGNRFYGSTPLRSQPGEEGPEGRSAATFPHPQHLLCIGVCHDSGVTVTFKQGELIHHQTPQGMPLWLANFT